LEDVFLFQDNQLANIPLYHVMMVLLAPLICVIAKMENVLMNSLSLQFVPLLAKLMTIVLHLLSRINLLTIVKLLFVMLNSDLVLHKQPHKNVLQNIFVKQLATHKTVKL
jgi:hypothetical protein